MPSKKLRKAADEPAGTLSEATRSTENEKSSADADLTETFFDDLTRRIQTKLQKQHSKAAVAKSEPKESVSSTQNVKNGNPRGKKRKSDGTVLEATSSKTPSSKSPLTNGSSRPTDEDEEEDLRKAMKELGGTEEDFGLLAGAESDSEIEGSEIDKEETIHKSGKSLQQGMANILQEISLAQNAQRGGKPSEEDASEPDLEEEKIASMHAQKETVAVVPEKKTPKKSGKSRLKCEPRSDWFSRSSDIDLEKEPKNKPAPQAIENLHSFAKVLLTAENEAFGATQQSSSSQAFYNTVIASGTLSDKISALTLAVQESPLHNVKPLESLIGMAGKRSRAQAVEVLRALKDLFAQGSMLPGDRRLYTFATQPALLAALGQVKTWKQNDQLPRGLTEADLIAWAFEDWLKVQYFEMLKILEIWCNDEIEFSKSRAISYVYELLKERPEQETNLLRLLVNKIGDPIKKIASQTSYLLMQLLVSHPAMKLVVISAIEADFLFRPGQSVHGKYYAVTTLNQTALSVREEGVTNKLLDIYFALFTGLLKTADEHDSAEPEATQSSTRGQRQRKQRKGRKENEPLNQQGEELREKLISAILTGVNRAYPYAGADQKNFDKHLDTLFKITHSANFNTGIQAMMLIQQLTTTHGASADRFYRTLYESLLDPRLVSASKQQLYLNLLHRSLKADLNLKRVKAFVKRILQILSLQDPSFVCGSFFLLKDLETAFPSLSALLEQAEQDEDDEEVFRDVEEDMHEDRQKAMYENVVQTNRYDGHKRAPEHANAGNSCVWEVLPFLAHFHPSVSVSAESYLARQKLPGKPDLQLHTLIHFLDRFVYRNAKLASNKLRGASIMQPMANGDPDAVLISSDIGMSGPSVNTFAFRSKKDVDVAANDVFFHKYFATLGRDVKDSKKKKARAADGNSSDGEAAEDEVWKAMVDSAPDLEGAESEDDLDMSDFEAAMDDGDERDSVDEVTAFEEDGSGVDIEAGIFDDSEDEVSDLEQAMADSGSDVASGSQDGSSEEDETSTIDKKTKSKAQSEREQRKKRKALPTFASAADYAKMLEDDDDEDLD